ncbi:MAG: hypothetical protein GY934_06955 [Gammaproteobacteria bacterium]|nr:hypothetical protein [Gammaproteobacteria bacterium]
MSDKDFGWFGAGWAVYKGDVKDIDFFPPLGDIQAQREWLGGFGAAWAEYPDEVAMKSILDGDGMGGESVRATLAKTLEGKTELLRQLLAHSNGNQTRH